MPQYDVHNIRPIKKKPPRYAILILHLMHGVVVMMVMLLMMAAFRKCRGRQRAKHDTS